MVDFFTPELQQDTDAAGLTEQAPALPYAPSTLGERFQQNIGAVTQDAIEVAKRATATSHFSFYSEDPTNLEPTRKEAEPNVPLKTLKEKFPEVHGVDHDMPLTVAQSMSDVQERRRKQESVLARYPSGAGNAVLGFGADMVSGLLDPVADAAFMVPVVGEARYGAWLAQAGEAAGMVGRTGVTLGVGGARGAAGGALIAAGEYGSGLDPDMTLGDVARQTLDTAALGMVFHGAIDLGKGALGYPSDILGTRFAGSPAGEAAQGNADIHDAATRAAAAQLGADQPVQVEPVFEAADLRARLMSGTAVGQIPPESVTKLDNAVARAAGAPSPEAVALEDEVKVAKATPTEKVQEGLEAEAQRQIEDMRDRGALSAEDDNEIAALDAELEAIDEAQAAAEGKPAEGEGEGKKAEAKAPAARKKPPTVIPEPEIVEPQLPQEPRKRLYPSYTTEELRQALADTERQPDKYGPEVVARMREEIAAREAGTSKPKVTPQIAPGWENGVKIEAKPGLPERPKGMTVEMEGKTFPVASLEEASRLVRATIDEMGIGGSNYPHVLVRDENGGLIGHVAYNGRVFEGSPREWTAETKLLYESRSQPAERQALAAPADPYDAAREASSEAEAAWIRVRDRYRSGEASAAEVAAAAAVRDQKGREFRDQVIARSEPPAGEGRAGAGQDRQTLRDQMAVHNKVTVAGKEFGVRQTKAGWVTTETEEVGGQQYVISAGPGMFPMARDMALDRAATRAAEYARHNAPLETAVPEAEITPEEPTDAGGTERLQGEGGEPPGEIPAEPVRQDEEGREADAAGGQPGDVDLGIREQPVAEPGQPAGPEPGTAEQEAQRSPIVRGERRDEGISAPGRGERPADRPDGRVRGQNYRIEGDGPWALATTPRRRILSNLDAIEMLKQLEETGAPATSEQQQELAKYVGWGGAPQVFDEKNQEFAAQRTRLKALLTPEQFASARLSTINAHYTSPEIARAMWDGMSALGFPGDGTILEPGMGTGTFLATRPHDADPRFTGVELDDISGRISRLLYPQASIHIKGFERTRIPENTFDAAIGNVPFADIRPTDKQYNPGGALTLHNYFIVKAAKLTKPGGVMSLITTHYTLDSSNPGARQAMHDAGVDLIGAIRLPDSAFKKGGSGTEVTTDILFFRKRFEGEKPVGDGWLKTEQVPIGEGKARINRYFLDHPEDVLGKHSLEGSMYRGKDEYTVTGSAEHLSAEIRERARAIAARGPKYDADPSGLSFAHAEDTPQSGVKDGSFFERDGKILQQQPMGAIEAEIPKAKIGLAKGFIGLRDLAREVLTRQRDNWNGTGESPWAEAQGRLNKAYDDFVKKNGPINKVELSERKMPDGEVRTYRRYPNLKPFRDDPDWVLVSALENYNEETGKGAKAPIMSTRVLEPLKRIDHVDTPEEALIASMNQRGGVDVPYMEKILGKPGGEILASLPERVFEDPNTGSYELAENYLAGDVRAKLNAARAAGLTRNIAALEAVQPPDLEPSQIDVRLGAPWVPASDVADFVQELLGVRAVVRHIAREAMWSVELRSYSIANTSEWGVEGADAQKMIDDALNQRSTEVKYQDPEGNIRTDVAKTIVAQEKQQQIKDKFAEWIWHDPERARRLSRFYNDNFNNLRTPTYNGDHLSLPGTSPGLSLRPTQKKAIWRYLVAGNTLLDHVVGAGKTYTSIAAGMESKRLGLSKKPMYVVPNHMLEQFSREFLQLYPAAHILVADQENFAGDRRRQFVARASAGDWDAIVMTHSSFEKIPLSAERQAKFIEAEIADYEDAIRSAKGDRVTVKQLEKSKKRREEKLTAMMEAKDKDEGLSFEETGADSIFVDEAHLFKNLEFATKIRGMQSASSQRAFDLYAKSRYVNDLTPGRGLMFMTGTPVSNSMAELFTMQRYLGAAGLAERNLSHFDAWAAQFGDAVTKPEISPDGLTARLKTRFAQFRNIPELVSMYRQFADLVTSEDIGKQVKLPDIKGGKPQTVEAPGSVDLLNYVQDLAKRAEAVRKREVTPDVDNMLKISNDGRNAALDMRLVDPSLPPDPDRKIVHAADRVAKIWKDSTPKKGAQLVFLDRSTPKEGGKFNAYDDLRQELIKRGVPPGEIAYIHDADTSDKKARLFADVRAGRKRVLLGSTEKMGVGTNVQERLIALHNIDSPWRPADLEQRIGRIIRQGNLNPEVQLHNYVTVGSFDAYMWQTLERKARFIQQIKAGDPTKRIAEDIDDGALSYAEVKALASGNPLILKKADADAAADRLLRVRRAYSDQQKKLQWSLSAIPERRRALIARLADADADAAALNLGKGDTFSMTFGSQKFDKRADAAKAMAKEIEGMNAHVVGGKGGVSRPNLGEIGGFKFGVSQLPGGDPAVDVVQRGGTVRVFVSADAPAGALTRVENHLRDIGAVPAGIKGRMSDLDKDEQQIRALVGKPFDREEEYQEAISRQKHIDDLLGVNGEDAKKLAEDRGAPAPTPKAAAAAAGERESRASTKWDMASNSYVDPEGAPRTAALIREGKPLKDVLGHIADEAQDYTYKVVAKALQRVLGDEVRLRAMTDREAETPNTGHLRNGLYRPKSDTILVHIGMSPHPDQTLIHEAVHAATLKAIDNNTPTGKEITKVFKAYQDLAGAARGWRTSGDMYGMSNPHEFIAEFYANQEFRNNLAGMKELGNPTNLLQRIINAIKKFLGLPAADPLRYIIENEPRLLNPQEILSRAAEEGRGLSAGETPNISRESRARAPEQEQEGPEDLDMARAILIKKRVTAMQDIAKRDAIMSYIDHARSKGLGIAHGITAKMRGISHSIEGARDSTEADMTVNRQRFLGTLISGLERVPGAQVAWNKRLLTPEWTRELFELNSKEGKPGVTKNPLALKIAQAVQAAQDLARYDANKAGAWIGDYEGYIARTSHNPVTIHKAGYEAWRDYTLERLDPLRTFEDLSEEEVEKFMEGSWHALSTGIHLSAADGVSKSKAFEGGKNLAKRLSQDRVLHFKDADGWREYQQRFGNPDIELGIAQSLMRAGRDVALMKRWGSNPRFSFDKILRDVKEKYRGDHDAISQLSGQEARLREEFRHLTGEASIPKNDLAFRILSTGRQLQNISKLNTVLLAHLSVGATKPYQLRFLGMGRWQAYTSALRNLVQDKSPAGRATMEALYSNATGQIQQMMHGYEPFADLPGAIAKAEKLAMRLGGLPWLLAHEKAGTTWETANFFGRHLDRPFADLDPKMRRILALHALTPAEWDALRTAPDPERDGAGLTYLTPKAADRATPEAIDLIDPVRVSRAGDDADLERIRQDIRENMAMKLAALYSDTADRSVVTPGVAERAMFTRVGGDYLGPVLGQYKTWAAAAVRQMWGQAIYGMERGEAVKSLASLAAGMTALGAARVILRDALDGKEPNLPNGDPGHDATVFGSWIVGGGGLGLYGDFVIGAMIHSDSGREMAPHLISAAAGPLVADIAETAGNLFDAAKAPFSKVAPDDKAIKAIGQLFGEFVDHLPVVNAFYVRHVLNWLFLNQLQEMTNPGYLERYQKNVRHSTGQEFFLPPAQNYLGSDARN